MKDEDVGSSCRWIVVCCPSGNDRNAFLGLVRFIICINVSSSVGVRLDNKVLAQAARVGIRITSLYAVVLGAGSIALALAAATRRVFLMVATAIDSCWLHGGPRR